MKAKTFIDSFNCAVSGIIAAFRTQRNVKIHVLAAAAVIICALFLGLSRIEVVCLLFAISSVLVCEMLNTAIEYVLDISAKEQNSKVRVAKDIAAGATLLCAILAVLVGYLIFSPHLFKETHLPTVVEKIKAAPIHIVFIALFSVTCAALISKIFFGMWSKKGSYARGGMPSGHSAVAFSIWTIVLLLSKNPIIVILVFLLAALVSRSRIVAGYHNVWEVMIGAALGILCTLFLFKLFT